MPNVSLSGKGKRSSWESNLGPCECSSQMLLPLSYWTHGRGVEASLATARLEASVTSAVGYTAYNVMGMWAWGRLAVQSLPNTSAFLLYLNALSRL